MFRTVAELLVFLIDGVQTRIDHTSNAVGGLWVHLVFFSVAQVLAISSSLEAFGTTHTDPSYRWWWCLQDFFHLGGGIVLLMVAMGVFCIVTASSGVCQGVLLDGVCLLWGDWCARSVGVCLCGFGLETGFAGRRAMQASRYGETGNAWTRESERGFVCVIPTPMKHEVS